MLLLLITSAYLKNDSSSDLSIFGISNSSDSTSNNSFLSNESGSKPGPSLNNRLEYEESIFDQITTLLRKLYDEENPHLKNKIVKSIVQFFYMAQQFTNPVHAKTYASALNSGMYNVCYDILQNDIDNLPPSLWESHFKISCGPKNSLQAGSDLSTLWNTNYSTFGLNSTLLNFSLRKQYRTDLPYLICVDDEKRIVHRYKWYMPARNYTLHESIILPHYVFKPHLLIRATVSQDALIFNYLLSFVYTQYNEKYSSETRDLLKVFKKCVQSVRLVAVLHAKLAIYVLINCVLVGGDLHRITGVIESMLLEGSKVNEYNGSRYYNAILYAFGKIDS
ncbi:hypothetical protein COBT_002892 [Conglomerata obtusa]